MANQSDTMALKNAGYSLEHPGYWLQSVEGLNATISDGPDEDGVWSIQIFTGDGSEYVTGNDTCKTVDDVIRTTQELINNLED